MIGKYIYTANLSPAALTVHKLQNAGATECGGIHSEGLSRSHVTK
jgi:hypothetical protein